MQNLERNEEPPPTLHLLFYNLNSSLIPTPSLQARHRAWQPLRRVNKTVLPPQRSFLSGSSASSTPPPVIASPSSGVATSAGNKPNGVPAAQVVSLGLVTHPLAPPVIASPYSGVATSAGSKPNGAPAADVVSLRLGPDPQPDPSLRARPTRIG
jgi:hypothetical protein